MGTVIVKPGREKRLVQGYPWIQKSEVLRVDALGKGEIVSVLDSKNQFIGIGTFNRATRFQVRMLAREQVEINREFFLNRFRQAIDYRKQLDIDSNGMRLVFSEADRLPGLIVDKYGDSLVVQVRSLGMEQLRSEWIPALIESVRPSGIYEKSEMAGREDEGLPSRSEVIFGEVPDVASINELGLEYGVYFKTGLKTGFYFDQRLTRKRWREQVKPGENVLDAFCYTGSFALHAAAAGANALGIDINESALEQAKDNAKRNNLKLGFEVANAFEWLESNKSEPCYDWIMLDPPAIAKSSGKRDALKWAIWKLVYHALPLLKPGGRLVVCNCSFQLSLHETIETCRFAAADRGEFLNLEDITLQDADHPAATWFPESLYLKCVWLRKL